MKNNTNSTCNSSTTMTSSKTFNGVRFTGHQIDMIRDFARHGRRRLIVLGRTTRSLHDRGVLTYTPDPKIDGAWFVDLSRSSDESGLSLI